MPDEVLPFASAYDVRYGGLPSAIFIDRLLREQLRRVHRATFRAGELTLEQAESLGEVEHADGVAGGLEVVLRLDARTLVHVSILHGHGQIAVAGDDAGAVERVAADLVGALGECSDANGEVSVTFLARPNGPQRTPTRRVPAPAWDEIRSNYARATAARIDELTAAPGPGPGGLLLWHGPAGTGKSTALRALAREWRAWCDLVFVADPDALLGPDASYLLNALLTRDRHREDGERRWRLIVLEDAGELLAADARAVAGQAVSRLLNLSDGLLGAGLRTLVLVTTNEPLRRLHPAVARPGRCWMEVEFPELSAHEANAWLAGRGSEQRVERATALAELFALVAGCRVPRPQAIGFAG